MPPKINPDHAQKTIKNKDIASNILDNAPLFAGLEDFVLIQADRKEAKAPPVVKQKEKKSTVKKKINKTNTAESKSQPATKVPKPVSIDTDAVLLSVAETCSLLKISRATLIRMDKSGLLPGRIKMGGSVRFHRETVVNWLQSLISTHPAP